MQWSKLKQSIESRIATALRDRVSLFFTRYRNAPNEAGRWAIRIDDREIVSFGDLNHASPLANRDERTQSGQHDSGDFFATLQAYLDLSIEDALTSPDLLHRCLALLDARLGKRRLLAIDPEALTTPTERTCLATRLQAENIQVAERS